ncbi:pentatricopeptide repeat-containing protein At3g24000, mitochondrial [Morus notabilis]|uniref:pentatricopeptide repeat-containing protein At3g24000, mitochondrial n=1 Tax=Morus notabilis TaxID=981085 RepID=UPI000CED035C|nr:pentatricopeptide repeat-containing protein At3g24000, mitochondrial [Morus notabilis]
MKKHILCRKYFSYDGFTSSKNRGGGIVCVRFSFGTFVGSKIPKDSEISDAEDLEVSCVIKDKNFLHKSHENSGAGPPLYNRLLKRCTEMRKLREGKMVHAHFLNSQFRDDPVIGNTILNMYAKCGSLADARKLFDEMPLKDIVTWTALISGYSQHDQAEEALALFPLMLRRGLEPNQFTLSSLLKASGDGTTNKRGRQLHAYCLKCGYDSDVYVGSSLVDMYARYGHLVEARLIFDGLVTKNEVSWNALIAGHSRKGETENALRLFSMMHREDFKPTDFTYSSLCTACASTGSLEQGKWVHAHVIKSGGRLVAFVGNTLLDMYAKSGSIEDAKKVFDRLVKRDVVSWNSMLRGYAQHGLGRKTVQHFEEMMTSGIEPISVTFLSVLTACSHAGLLDEGRHYFELMKKYKVEPDVLHYVTMVDLLGRAGLLDQAERYIREMPIEPSAAVWGALLGACRMHKNMELGAYAAERVFELDPQDSGPHILLYNMYASAGRWQEAAKVRKMMKESGVKKEPACSWVEIENAVHMFIANDDAHPQWQEIREMWEKISGKIREIGYVPDTSHVLLFVDQQEREVKLQYHSEKLALAFALLNTPLGSTIRIKKNIRVCGDCHSAIKYVSKVVGREIIVRDTNRFHHFHNGSCSCGDYW